MNFCWNCRKKVEYTIKDEVLKAKIHGHRIKFNGQTAYCKVCGEPLFLDDIEDQNIANAREAFFILAEKNKWEE